NFRSTVSRGVVLGRNARGGLEHAMKVARTETDRVRQFVQRRFFFAVPDQPACLRDESRIFRVGRYTVGIAPPAGPKARGLCALQTVVELNILGICRTRRTRRSAIDAGGDDGIPQVAVRCFIAGNDSSPTWIIRY